MGADPRGAARARVAVSPAVVVLLVEAAVVGGWAALAPADFFRSFPAAAAGLAWVAADGPFNEHLVVDVGFLHLGLLAGTLAALRWGGRRALGVVWCVVSWPHLAFHATRAGAVPAVEAATSLGALLLVAVAATELVIHPDGRSSPPAP